MSLRAVVLDLGGVILEMGPAGGLPFGELDAAGRRALHQLIEPAGLGEEALESLLFGPWSRGHAQRRERGQEEGFEVHLERLAAAAGVAPERLLDAYFAPFGAWASPLPGAVDAVLAVAEAGFQLGLVSNVPLPGRCYRGVLARLGIAGVFQDLRFSHDEGSRKPAPVMLERCLAALEVAPSAAVMVGDRRLEDVGSGRAAGTRTVWLESGYDEGPEADATISSLMELPALLERWNRSEVSG